MTGLLGDMWDGVSNFLGKPKIATPKRIEPKEEIGRASCRERVSLNV